MVLWLIIMREKYTNFVFYRLLFPLKFVENVFVYWTSESIISAHVITESSLILAKYFPFSQLHVAGFQI